MMTLATLNSVSLLLQEASPPQDPATLYPMYMVIIGGAAGAAAWRTVLRNLSPLTTLLVGIIGSLIGGYLGIAVLGHRNIALSGGLIGAIIALAITAMLKRSGTNTKPSEASVRTTAEPQAAPSFSAPSPAPPPPSTARPAAAVQTPAHSYSGDIFISYASADRPFAQRVAAALQSEGWAVWWDRAIPPGKTFDAVIEEALDAAKCVIVLWSKSSVASDWVKVEASEAARRRILIPALIDSATIPLEFRRIQAASLVDWTGSSEHPGFVSLTNSVRDLLGAPR